jgi:hypothetical protein
LVAEASFDRFTYDNEKSPYKTLTLHITFTRGRGLLLCNAACETAHNPRVQCSVERNEKEL